MIDEHHGWNKSFKPLVLGFLLSVLLTVAAYRIVTHHHLSNSVLPLAIFGFVTVQALLQFVFFLHLGLGSKPHWNMITFLFMVLIVVVIVGGSLWIMYNLNYNMMVTGNN